MGYYAYIDERYAGDVGWNALCERIDKLKAKQFPGLTHLRKHGWSEEVNTVCKELVAALALTEAAKVPDKNFLATAPSFIRILKKHAGAEVLVVTDGVGFEDDENEEEEASRPVERRAKTATPKSAKRSRRPGATNRAGPNPAKSNRFHYFQIPLSATPAELKRIVDEMQRLMSDDKPTKRPAKAKSKPAKRQRK